ncbi:MAG: branched-chain amino acid transporter permease [Betaproteobacteria bacterium]|nr:branched-chain amino acid transporter permease [Betaproteobacteria bacterium]
MSDLYLNAAVGGALTGLVYGLMALGLSVIFGVVRVVNFAHGEMMTGAMYGAILLAQAFKLDPLVAMAPIAIGMFLLGYGLQRGLVNSFVQRPEHTQFMLMVAVAIILTNSQLIAFGPNARNVQVDYALDSYQFGALIIDKVRIFAAIAALAVSGALFAFFRFTLTGRAIRACADNYLGAQVVGLNVKHLYGLTFGIGAACLGAAGCLLLLLLDVTPLQGPSYTLLAFIIVIVGGMGSLTGALLSGLLVGVSEALAGVAFDPSAKSMFTFALLILVLLFRPQGLLGRRP